MIVRVAHRARYTVICNTAIDDPRLSFQALGLLAFLLSKPDQWEVNYRHLATVRTGPRGEGQHAVRQTLRELEEAGYLLRAKVRTDAGTYVWVSTIYEAPVAVDEPCGGSPRLDNRVRGSRGLDGRRSSVSTEEPTPEEQSLSDTARSDSSPLERVVREPVGPVARARLHPELARATIADAQAQLRGARS